MQLLDSGIVLTSFIAGIVALLAPCCVSVMLPAYFASGLRRRRRIVAMTFVFAAGVATLILPIALGASILSRALQAHHTPIFASFAVLMAIAGVATLLGRAPKLPMLVNAPLVRPGVSGVWVLGAFSGAASACCAPVLAGVVGLAGAGTSFPLALTIGVAYVFGMVAPLAFLALVWDRRDWGSALAPARRTMHLTFAGRGFSLPLANLLAGALMLVMGVLTMISAINGPSMSNTGWQVRLTARINHLASQLEHRLAFLPGWLATGTVLALGIVLVLWARRTDTGHDDDQPGSAAPTSPDATRPDAGPDTTATASEQDPLDNETPAPPRKRALR